jgi:hypothetical protein
VKIEPEQTTRNHAKALIDELSKLIVAC